MKTELTLNGIKVVKDIPETWDKVPFKQFKKLAECGTDRVKKLSLFTDIDEVTLRKAEIKNLDTLMEVLRFTEKETKYELPLEVLGHKIPHNLEVENIARYADLQKIIDENKENILDFYPLIVATYVVNPYDYKEAEKLASKFEYAPCWEVMAIGNFTLAKLLASRASMLKLSPPEATRLRRLRRDIRNWLLRLVFTIHYFSWKKSLPSPERNFLSGL